MSAQLSTSAVVEPLLTVSDVRDLLRISRSSVYQLIRRGDIVPVRVGNRLRFTPDEIRRYLDGSRGTAP